MSRFYLIAAGLLLLLFTHAHSQERTGVALHLHDGSVRQVTLMHVSDTALLADFPRVDRGI